LTQAVTPEDKSLPAGFSRAEAAPDRSPAAKGLRAVEAAPGLARFFWRPTPE
jgi:hypothetical protein